MQRHAVGPEDFACVIAMVIDLESAGGIGREASHSLFGTFGHSTVRAWS